MEGLGFHITVRLANDQNLGADVAMRRALATTVLAVARPFALLAFRWVDTHGHLEVVADRAQAAECARRVEIALTKRLAPRSRFEPARLRPLLDAAHVRHTFFYILRQDQHHGLVPDPTHDASNLPDLLGARQLGGWTSGHVRAHLPRVRRAELLEAVSLADPDRAPLGMDALVDAASGAWALPNLDGRGAAVVRARAAGMSVGAERGTAWLAAQFGVDERTVRRLLARGADPAAMRAVRQQLVLRERAVTSPILTAGTSPPRSTGVGWGAPRAGGLEA